MNAHRHKMLLGALLGLSQAALAQTPVPPAVVVVTPPVAPPATAPAKSDPATSVTSAPAPPPAETAGGVATITVAGERPTNRIDRQVYEVKDDIASTNSSAADALNNVPSVSVDPDGTVSLRGSTNVQIYIDGKPTAMMQGDSRAAALLSMASDDIESIEVINNPGAQFGNDGGGGPILNIVMKRNRRPGGFASTSANGGTAGRYNTATSGSYHEGPWGIQGGINFRHDGRDSVGFTDRERRDTITGLMVHSEQASTSRGLNDALGVNASGTYNIGQKDTLAANVSYARRTNGQLGTDRYQTFGAGEVTVSDYLRTTRRTGESNNYSWGAHVDHKGAVSGELAKLDLRVSSATNTGDNAYRNAFAVSTTPFPNPGNLQANRTDTRIVDFTGDYELPTDFAMIKAGFKVADNNSGYDTGYTSIDPVTLAQYVNVQRSNSYTLDEGNVAAYGSLQWRLDERWGVLAGLRTEYTHIDIEQTTAQVAASNHYVNYIPSAFATYKASDDTNIRFSYAHRIRRARAGELNPFVVYRDELNVSSGNPTLKPAQTDSLEVGLETRVAGLEANLRAYMRADRDAILTRRHYISDTVLLSMPENGGGNRASGLEFTLSGKLDPTFSINTSGNLNYIDQTVFDTTGAELQRNAVSLSLRGRFNYQPTKEDFLQLSLNGQGRTLSGLGYREPFATANWSMRHNVTPALSLVLNITDIFNTNKSDTATDTDALRETSQRRYDGRVVYVGLSYRIGGFTPTPRGPGQGEGRRQAPQG
jgi:outer membrane receptor protein involved in Fe transport